ncbi:TetR/AcrR family transcriptional regulator [Actinoplanes sichuanensis]|uniref:TetR/AcrR family transcriptional regulator n=1 Tax=Actinoplanes sichuanensis TaxID=512349 RepID=A0ABW4A1V8_9ACTN|nr:TetR/AcrR family transcriptional regulator [Actinoplanes sichuanensis]BEL04260.1 TetR/AcrR family transcriptional regulator [Actinoplanes sichuanensis]
MESSERAPDGDHRLARGDARRARILTAATAEFGRKGYDGARVSDIARSAGVTDAGVLHHFGTKYDLFMAVVERREEVYQTIKLTTESVRALFDEFIAVVRLAAREPDLLRFRVMLTGASRIAGHPVEGRAGRNLEAALDTLVPFVQERIAAGEIAEGTDPQQLVLELLALNDGIRDQWSALPDRIDYVAVFTAAADGLYERVRAR